MSDYPDWITPSDDETAPGVDVDWAALGDGWRGRDHRRRYAGEDVVDHCNRIRAQVSEGLAPADALRFADWLEDA